MPFQDMHVLELSHYSHGGANISWSQIVDRTGPNREDRSTGVHEFEMFLKYRGLVEPPKYYFTV